MNLQQSVYSQFKQPHGFLGKLAGHIMANRPSNIERNVWGLETVHLKSTDRFLEIGYGPGLAIQAALRSITQGQVVGIDHSDEMFKQASLRNADAIESGRAKLIVGCAEDFSPEEGLFDHIFSANVVQFWDDPVKTFAHLKSLLSKNGVITTLYMPRNKGATSQDTEIMREKIYQWLHSADIEKIYHNIREFSGLNAICVSATNNSQN